VYCLPFSEESLRKTRFGCSDPHNQPAVNHDSVEGITSEHSQLNEVCGLLDLLYGEPER
jgi:hypothetical protein